MRWPLPELAGLALDVLHYLDAVESIVPVVNLLIGPCGAVCEHTVAAAANGLARPREISSRWDEAMRPSRFHLDRPRF